VAEIPSAKEVPYSIKPHAFLAHVGVRFS